MRTKIFIVVFLSVGILQVGFAGSDTTRVSLKEMEQKFIDSNLGLIAAHYNIDATQAGIVQAKLFPNMRFSWEQNIYNTVTKRYFPMSANGQNIFSLTQVFEIAGQRNKRVRMEKIRTEIATYEFYDLLRTLRYQLRSACIRSWYTENSLKLISDEISSIQSLIIAFEAQQEKGNVTLKDVMRLKTLLFSLETQRTELLNSVNDTQKDLKILVHDTTADYISVILKPEKTLEGKLASYNAEVIRDSAIANRQDLRIAEFDAKMEKLNLSYQKSEAVPDLEFGVLYDRAGSFVNDYTAFTIAIDLPIWNQNNGNIKAAKFKVNEKQATVDQYRNIVFQESLAAFEKIKTSLRTVNTIDEKYLVDSQILLKGMQSNFEKRNLSILEFVDFIESYTDALLQYNELNYRLYDAVENFNYSVGKIMIEELE